MEPKPLNSGQAISDQLAARLQTRLALLYPQSEPRELQAYLQGISEIVQAFAMDRQRAGLVSESTERWTENDVVLITYGDQVSEEGAATLATLKEFLERFSITDAVSVVHLLPFYPYSTDDGFSVIDYYDLAPGMGTWQDVERLGQSVDLMFDLVLNHCSWHNDWFKKFQLGDPDYVNFFHVVPEGTDVSRVVRPRNLPLLTRVPTTDGEKLVWTTFSDDQVDLNFSEPAVLLEFIRILLFYVQRGARIIRLDAVAFLWKIIGTECIHLRPTHEVIKLFRDLLDEVAPEVILLTETNVPHPENISYFGEGDEAHMVYQFSLPPLVVDTLIHQDATPLREWLIQLEPPPTGTTFFNFGASHDGIGVRPLEGLLEPDRFASLIQEIEQRGGHVSTRRKSDGSEAPYELNISYWNAIVGNETGEPEVQIRKFLTSQAILLSLPGIPGIYFHSLVGTPNDSAAAQASKIPRRINRRKYGLDELSDILADPDNIQARLMSAYLDLLRVRKSSRAFHPDGACQIWDETRLEEMGSTRLLAFERTSPDGDEQVLVIVNPTANEVDLRWPGSGVAEDLVDGSAVQGGALRLEAFGFRWLRRNRGS